VPAAAVIPAPRAYTNIAAVKTLVVCHRAAGLLGGQPLPGCGLLVLGLGFCLGGAGFNPQWYVPAPTSFADGENRSCRKPASLQAKVDHASHTGYGHKGTQPVLGRYPVHHRSPPSLTPWKTQCAQSILLTAECPSMECRGIDRVWHWSCAGLGAHSGQPGGCSRGTTWTQFHLGGLDSSYP
jgi:hypothetical protein